MDGTTDYTIEAWIYPTNLVSGSRIISRYYSFQLITWTVSGDGNKARWYFEINTNNSGGYTWYYFNANESIVKNQWNHLAVICNSTLNSVRLYLNGTDVTSSTYSATAIHNSVANDNLYVGQRGDGNNYFTGYVDEVRLKNVAVDLADLHNSITDNSYYSDENTAVLFHFDEGTGDSTTNAVNSVKGRLGSSADGDAAQPTWVTTPTGLPLPVELTSFTASKSGNSVILNWETATEVNNYGFDVESSNDNNNWTSIGFVDGHGNSNSPQSYSFVATDGAKYYRLKQVDTDGGFEYSNVVEVEGNLSYKLSQNHPNPFNPTTKINFSIPEAAKVTITIFNALGQEVAELANREFAKGNHSVDFNATNLTSGIYIYRMNSANFSKTMKMMLIK